MARLALLCAALLAVFPARACEPRGVAVQVLGSGGPIADSGRAASGYLVWVDGRARVLVDAGGGVFLRYGESGADVADLDLVAITHLHTDHVADLPALLKGATFSPRRRPLALAGPSGNARFPSLREWLASQFDGARGAWRYLSGLLDGGADSFVLRPLLQVDVAAATPTTVLDRAGLRVLALGVPHGPVPALGYRVEAGGWRIVFSGDQDGRAPAFWDMARAADLLVMAHAVPEQADPVARRLHATPGTIGTQAQRAGVRRLLLSHLMARSLARLEQSLALIRTRYDGPVEVATDLGCHRLGAPR